MRIIEFCPKCDGESKHNIAIEDLIKNNGVLTCSECGAKILICQMCKDSCFEVGYECATCSENNSHFKFAE